MIVEAVVAKKLFDLDAHIPQVMAVLNVTPDSFSDGGSCFSAGKVSVDKCVERVEKMIVAGASIIDVGGESTRPGANPVSVDEEMQRVLPVLEVINRMDVVISIDTSSPGLIREAARMGIGLINDVRALQCENALQEAAASGLPVCLMHMQGQPVNMQCQPKYNNVLDDVSEFLEGRISACLSAGIARENLLLDPGFGFGKTLEHNAALLASLEQLKKFGLPMLVGLSRKSMISQLLGNKPVGERLAGSIALAVMAVERGAWIVRAHDIQETVDAVTIASRIMRAKND